MIKIITRYSKPGGSTEVFCALTNALNKRGHKTVFMGPHKYHLSKCNSYHITQGVPIEPDDILILHLMSVEKRPKCKQVIYSCHEHEVFRLTNENIKGCDKVHFVSEHQKVWHDIDKDSFVIPPYVEDLQPTKCAGNVAGVIGLIFPLKQTHVSIERALADGFEKVLVYGAIDDPVYFKEKIQPLVDNEKVRYMGHHEDKQMMYNTISHMYVSSLRETYSMTISEAMKANVIIEAIPGSEYIYCYREMHNEKITDMWLEELNV